MRDAAEKQILAEDISLKCSVLSRVLNPPLVSVVLLIGTLLLLVPSPAMAQLGGENLRGDYGMKSGSQGPPGFYLGDIFYFYRTDTIKDLNGDDLSKAPAIDIFGNIILSSYVTKKKILGANYAFMVALPILNAELALPSLDVGSQTWGLGDIYIKPLELGWHFKHADAIAGYAFFAPTGRYTAGAHDNTGLGMWSNEFSAGTTVYFDQGRKWHAAGTGFFEIHTSKQDLDAKSGNVFTLEGGVGRAFLQGYANAGLAYVGQWKASEDSGRDVNPLVLGKNGSMFALGPELNMPVSKKGIFLGFKYLFDIHSRLATSGNYLLLSLTYVRPSK
jgi:hypothetical protein